VLQAANAKQEEIAAGKSGAMATAEAALRWCARLCGHTTRREQLRTTTPLPAGAALRHHRLCSRTTPTLAYDRFDEAIAKRQEEERRHGGLASLNVLPTSPLTTAGLSPVPAHYSSPAVQLLQLEHLQRCASQPCY
jgi:DNA-binding transcriptional MocR family regulator